MKNGKPAPGGKGGDWLAQRRMFSLSVVDTDRFLSLPVSAQNLYFHFGMRADDDGFVSAPRKIMAFVKSSEDDFALLVAKGFLIPFPSGVCVIREWRVNNYIQRDRYHETRYLQEKRLLGVDSAGVYCLPEQSCIQDCIQPGYPG